jgi:hypothetical protein
VRQAAWFQEAEALAQPPADALPLATAAWDALACVRLDEAADVMLRVLHPPLADGVEISADQAPDVRAQDGTLHQWELPAAPAAERASSGLCKPDVAQSAEQSCAAPEAAALLDAAQSGPRAAHLRKSLAALPQTEPARPAAALSDALAVR